jgi:2-isopropylmalate synthase
VNLADTVGYLMPEEFADLIKFVREKAIELDHAHLSVHVHDDLGLALASTLAAVQAGVDQVECTINGIGDRAGICALEELVHILKIRQDYFFSMRTDIHEEFLVPISRLVAQSTGTRVPYFKSVVGSRARKSGAFLDVQTAFGGRSAAGV